MKPKTGGVIPRCYSARAPEAPFAGFGPRFWDVLFRSPREQPSCHKHFRAAPGQVLFRNCGIPGQWPRVDITLCGSYLSPALFLRASLPPLWRCCRPWPWRYSKSTRLPPVSSIQAKQMTLVIVGRVLLLPQHPSFTSPPCLSATPLVRCSRRLVCGALAGSWPAPSVLPFFSGLSPALSSARRHASALATSCSPSQCRPCSFSSPPYPQHCAGGSLRSGRITRRSTRTLPPIGGAPVS